MAVVPSVNPAVWIYVLIGTENVQKHIKICPEEISCNIPLCDYEVLPPKQHDRMSRFEDKFLIMGTGMISYKYVLIAADPAARTWLFAGPASQEDVMVVKLQDKKTVIFTVFAQLECKEEWAEPMVRAKVQYAATGLDLKEDGWLFPSSGRLYLRALEEYVLQEMDLQRLGGPHVELVFLGRGHEMISKQSPLWDPRAKVTKPHMRVWGKRSAPECALLSKVSKR